MCGTFFLLNALSTPAQAQFFQNAETWMTGQFTGAGEAIPLVFNVLRGLFLIYLGIYDRKGNLGLKAGRRLAKFSPYTNDYFNCGDSGRYFSEFDY